VESTFTLPCVVCGAELEPAFNNPMANAEPNQPHGGTTFLTNGHYGSTVFDQMDRTELQINLCDPCLLKAAEAGRVLHYAPPRPRPPRAAALWAPTKHLYDPEHEV